MPNRQFKSSLVATNQLLGAMRSLWVNRGARNDTRFEAAIIARNRGDLGVQLRWSHERPIHTSRVFKTYFLRSRPIVAIQFHHLTPGDHKVTDERLQLVAARIDFREGSELRLRQTSRFVSVAKISGSG